MLVSRDVWRECFNGTGVRTILVPTFCVAKQGRGIMLQSVMTFLGHFGRRLIVRVTLYAVLAVLAVVAAMVVGPYVPSQWISYLGTGALETVLTTLASSLLAVTTFSLSILASTFRAVEGSATPRAVLILREDQTTHRILSIFIGAFLFSLTSIILLATPLMTSASRFVLFLVTLVMVMQVVVAIIRWIHHIEILGSIENLLDCVQTMAAPVIADHWRNPCRGANVLDVNEMDRGEDGLCLYAVRNGYVKLIAVDALQEEAEACQGRIFVHVQPGQFVTKGDLLMRIDSLKEIGEVRQSILKNAVLIDSSRSFDQDPEFGVIVMTEIGNRALSSGVNDPQTAVDVVYRLGATLMSGAEEAGAENEIMFDRLWFRPVSSSALFTSSFDVIAREGGDLPEVKRALRQMLEKLAEQGNPDLSHEANSCRARLALDD